MKNLTFVERMQENGGGNWESAFARKLVRVKRSKVGGYWRGSVAFYLKKEYNTPGSSNSLANFFSQWIPREEIDKVQISYEGQIAIIIDEILFRTSNKQLEFDFTSAEKISV